MIYTLRWAGASRARTYAVAFARCYNAAIVNIRVRLTSAERLRLQRILSQLEALGFITLSRIAKSSRPLTLALLIAELARYFGRDIIEAVKAAAVQPASVSPHPSTLIPLWDFEPEDEHGDVLITTGQLFGVDLLFQALRVTDPDLPELIEPLRDRYARWRKATGSADLGTVCIPGWAGHYVVFASPHPLS